MMYTKTDASGPAHRRAGSPSERHSVRSRVYSWARVLGFGLGLGLGLVLGLGAIAACGSDNGNTQLATCAQVTCDANATCEMMNDVPLCACNDGYEGDRQVCNDIDECASGAHECAADETCVNNAGAYSCVRPETCADIQAQVPNALDGVYTLYLGGLASQPWTAYCLDLDIDTCDPELACAALPAPCDPDVQGRAVCDAWEPGVDFSEPMDYLPLVTTGGARNVAEYRATTDGKTGKDVTSWYSALRIDPVTLSVDVTDAMFADTIGSTVLDDVAVAAVPFGVAMSCDHLNPALANIDLTGLPFVMTSGLCQGGFAVSGEPTGVPGDTSVDMWAMGACGWTRGDDACTDNPLTSGAGTLQLAYTTYTKRVFVTGAAYPSDLGGVTGADAICQTLAAGAGLPGTYMAWLGASSGHPSERFVRHQVPYVLVDNTVVANGWSDLTDGRLAHAIDMDENGQAPSAGATVMCTDLQGTAVWTGTSAAGQDLAADWACSDWTGTGQGLGVGSYDRVQTGWSDACRLQAGAGEDICQGQFAHLYCFEQ